MMSLELAPGLNLGLRAHWLLNLSGLSPQLCSLRETVADNKIAIMELP